MTEELESTSQSQTCTRKRSRSLVVCCPSDPLQLSESQENHSIWEVCSGNRWDAPKTATPAASIGQQKGPDSSPRQQRLYTTQPLLHKLNELGYKVLPRLLYSPDLSQPTTTSSSIWTIFCRENASTTSRRQKILSKTSLKRGFLHNRNKQTFLISKTVLIVMVPILINKNVFDPSYND